MRLLLYDLSQQSITCSNLANKAQRQGVKTLQMKTVERSQWRRSGDFIVKCEHVSHFALIVDFEQANTSAGLHIENT